MMEDNQEQILTFLDFLLLFKYLFLQILQKPSWR